MSILKKQAHTTWDCIYHVIIVPKYRKKILYQQVRKRTGEILRELARQKDVEVIQGTACSDHVHLILSIPPKHSVAQVIGFMKGKSAIRMFHEFSKKKFLANRSFWSRGYFVRTAGIDLEIVERYVKNQLDDDQRSDSNPQLDLNWS